jgi:hypothetical protein
MKALLINLLLIPLGCFGGAKAPKVTPAPQVPEEQAAAITAARSAEARRRRAAASQTILTSPRGITSEAATVGKKLLGQ